MQFGKKVVLELRYPQFRIRYTPWKSFYRGKSGHNPMLKVFTPSKTERRG